MAELVFTNINFICYHDMEKNPQIKKCSFCVTLLDLRHEICLKINLFVMRVKNRKYCEAVHLRWNNALL